jgi:hypothetical protein
MTKIILTCLIVCALFSQTMSLTINKKAHMAEFLLNQVQHNLGEMAHNFDEQSDEGQAFLDGFLELIFSDSELSKGAMEGIEG